MDKTVKAINVSSGLGDLSRATTNAFLGYNIRGNATVLPINKDNQGFTFFTRPRLNLTYDNASKSRILFPMVNARENSLLRALRVYLDPVSENGGSHRHMRGHKPATPDNNLINLPPALHVTSPLVDPLSPFIPILTNTLESISGWPDEVVDTYTSEPGVGNESWSMVDTYVRNYGTFDLNASFRNIAGDAITALFRIWNEYMGQVQSGRMTMWPDALMEYERDYMTRIFRIVLDPTRQRVQKIASAVGAFPIANPIGTSFNYNKDRPYSEDNASISVPLRCEGVEYNDPILIEEFNEISFMFNPALEQSIENRNSNKDTEYMLVSSADVDLFNFNAYPIINPTSWDLEWWVKRTTYKFIRETYYNG